MSDDPKAMPEDAETEVVMAESDETPEPETEPLAAEEQGPGGEADGIEASRAEIADLKDRLLRAAAEMENMRRRFEREMVDTRQYAVTGFAREVLSIGDNLSRALGAVPEESRSEGEAMKALLEGVEMTERELLRVLDKHGVKLIESHGEKFDPNLHQAIFEVEHEEAPHGTVVQVVQPGYTIGERVLRPAMVGVAKAAQQQTATTALAVEAESAPAETPPDAANED